MKVYLGADHRGYGLKEKIKLWLEKANYSHEDFGAYSLDPNDDYPLYAEKVAAIVGKENSARGILFCGSGVGVDVVANKIDGVRSSIGKSAGQVKAGREDDDMNVLVIASDFTKETEARAMVKNFLDSNYKANARHDRRLSEIKRIEENN